MSIRSGFFNSVNKDRLYDAEDLGNYFEGLISNGIFESIGNKLLVTSGTGMSVNVDTGRAFINCHWMTNDAILTLPLDAADVQYKRIDRIIVRLDTSDSVRDMNIYVLKGTNSLNPVAPPLTRTLSTYEICLADIYVDANVTSISQSNITDRRGNTSLCGFVTGLIEQVDTTDLFIQYQDAFETYYKNATAEFDTYYQNSTAQFDAYCQNATAEFDEYMATKKAAFDSWFERLTSTLTVDTTLTKSQLVYQTTTETIMVNIGDLNYEVGDILLVHVGGVLFIEGVEYQLVNNFIEFENSIAKDNTITIICIKSVVGTGQLVN